MKKKTKILLINFGGLGDQILFFPLIKTVKSVYPDAIITFATEPRSKSASKLTDTIDETIICDIKSGNFYNIYKNIIKFLLKVWQQRFDIVISSGSSIQVCVLLFLTGIKTRIGYYSGFLSGVLLTGTVLLNKNQYAANMYHDLVKALKTDIIGNKIPEILVKKELLEKYESVLRKSGKKIIVIHPGVSKLSIKKNILKFWKTENWTEFIKKLLETGKYKVILTGGEDDREISDAICKNINNFEDFTNKTSDIAELAAIIKLADVLVCVDSAPMHTGVGVKTPTVALFGPTDENKLLPASDPEFKAVYLENLKCRPCLWDKRQTSCENPVCLEIPVEKVFLEVEKQISSETV